MTIKDEAVTAAAKVLYADKISNHAGDNAPQIIDACEKVARKVLDAIAPQLMAEALEEAATKFQARSETFLATMQNMTGLPEYTHDDILRYGAYSAEARVAALRLRSSADAYRSAGAGE